MKLSVLPVSFYSDIIDGQMSLGEWAHMGSDLGLDAIDVSILFFPDRSPQALAQARREIEDEGMSLAMMSTYPDFTHPDPKERASEHDRARETVDVAQTLGLRFVRAIAGQGHPETGRSEGIAWAVDGLSALVDYSRGSGVTIVYENHDQAGVMEYQDFSAAQDVFLAICEATSGIGLGVNFDTANATVLTPDPMALLEHVIDRVVTLHANDAYRVEGGHRWAVVGTGLVPFPALFARLHEAGWDNWICIEEASQQGPQAVRRAVEFVRRAWAEASG